MDAERKPVSWGCLLAWVPVTLVAVVIGSALFFVVMAGLGARMPVIPDLAAGLVLTVCLGTGIGSAQWAILRRYVQPSGLWIGATLLGFLFSSPVLLSRSGGFGPAIAPQDGLAMAAALGASLGIAQWLVIYNKVSRSTLWIAISLASWIAAGLLGLVLKSMSLEMGPVLYWLGLFFLGTVFSGLGMIWLLRGAKRR
jgi:hypothetical protein